MSVEETDNAPENVYDAIIEENDARWAYGTGFHDPLTGVDTALPAGVPGADLAAYCLMLGDDALIMSHRLQEWCSRAPELEEDVALANIALDLLGQARLLLSRAGQADGSGRDEDELAFLRGEHEFRNVRLVEPENADFAQLIMRLLLFSVWRLALLDRLTGSRDPVLAAIAAKGVKEVAYHRDHAARWAIRLGDGTVLSHRRAGRALEAVLPLADELFVPTEIERRVAAAGVGVDPAAPRAEFETVLAQVLSAAKLTAGGSLPMAGAFGRGGRDGAHTAAMGPLLAVLQGTARAHPEASW